MWRPLLVGIVATPIISVRVLRCPFCTEKVIQLNLPMDAHVIVIKSALTIMTVILILNVISIK